MADGRDPAEKLITRAKALARMMALTSGTSDGEKRNAHVALEKLWPKLEAAVVNGAPARPVDSFSEFWREVFGVDITRNERLSVKKFLRRGLSIDFLIEAAEITAAGIEERRVVASAAWRYFCGICWREIKGDRP